MEKASTSSRGTKHKAPASQDAVPESRREKNKRQKMERIVTAARTLFRINGYNNTTTQQVADAADIGTGTLFLYAKSKGDLLLLVFKDELQDYIDQAWRALPDQASLYEQVDALLGGIISYHERDIPTARALMRELAFPDNPDRREDIVDTQESILEKLTQLVETARSTGEVRDNTSPRVAAECMFSIYHEQLELWLSDYVDYPVFRENLKRRIDFIIDGIKPANHRD
ncbi:MAG: TetR/AcrR family transcriptional regulator [Haliea sp.]